MKVQPPTAVYELKITPSPPNLLQFPPRPPLPSAEGHIDKHTHNVSVHVRQRREMERVLFITQTQIPTLCYGQKDDCTGRATFSSKWDLLKVAILVFGIALSCAYASFFFSLQLKEAPFTFLFKLPKRKEARVPPCSWSFMTGKRLKIFRVNVPVVQVALCRQLSQNIGESKWHSSLNQLWCSTIMARRYWEASISQPFPNYHNYEQSSTQQVHENT